MKLRKKILYLQLKGISSPHIPQIEEYAENKNTERTCDKEHLLPPHHRHHLNHIPILLDSTLFIPSNDVKIVTLQLPSALYQAIYLTLFCFGRRKVIAHLYQALDAIAIASHEVCFLVVALRASTVSR